MKSLRNIGVTALCFVFIAMLSSCGESVEPIADVIPEDTFVPPPPPNMEFGFYVDSFLVHEDSTEKDQFFSDILLPHHITWGEMESIQVRAEGIFNINRDLRPDRRYMVLASPDSTEKAQYFIYEKDPINYVVFDFTDTMRVYEGARPVDTVVATVWGEIAQGSSLSRAAGDSIGNIRISESLVDEIADIYAWTIDFFNIKAGDRFKIIYEEKYVEDLLVGRGKIKGVYFYHNGTEFYGIPYMQDSSWAYFDENGKGLKKAFLKAPLKYSRISSGYSKRRFHPVQGRWKAHLGTDYAAPKGTPIWSVGDGTVIAASYTSGNGNYVKIKHNETFTTQYLHMTKFADGIKKGVRVRQGETIGYVGSTGLATGPHVCFRFWKNGKQVDHRQEKFETAEPVREENKDEFKLIRDKVKAELDAFGPPPMPRTETVVDTAAADSAAS